MNCDIVIGNMKRCIIILFGLLFAGCPEPIHSGKKVCTGWLWGYYGMNRGDISYVEYDEVDALLRIHISTDYGKTYGTVWHYVFDVESRYEEMCAKFDDSYCKDSARWQNAPGYTVLYIGDWKIFADGIYYNSWYRRSNERNAICETITDVSVTSDSDWDAAHPVVTLLNDLFCIEYKTFSPFIRSKLTSDEIVTTVKKPMSELTDDELVLLARGEDMILSTKVFPVETPVSINIGLSLDTGEEIENSIKYEIE